MRYFALLIFVILTPSLLAQSKPVRDLMKRTDEVYAQYRKSAQEAARDSTKEAVTTESRPLVFSDKYLYPSIMRAMNFSGDSLLTELSLQMTELAYLTSAGGTEEETREAFNFLRPDLEANGFELWIEYSGNPSGWLTVRSEDDLITHLVGAVLKQGQLLIVDYKGNLTPQQLMDLRNVDMGQFTGTLDLQSLFEQ